MLTVLSSTNPERRITMKVTLLSMALLFAASAASGQTADTSVVCAVHKLTAMGYTIESANKDFGLVKATKRRYTKADAQAIRDACSSK